MNSFINAQGYAMTGMTSVAIGAVANCILDPLFIFVLQLGIRGAAIATVISQTLSAAFVLYFLKKRSELNVRFLTRSELSRCTETAKNIISLGTAGFIMQLTNSLVSICCNNVLSVTGGDIYISVMTIISSVRQLVETPLKALPASFVGQALGLLVPISCTHYCASTFGLSTRSSFWVLTP